MIDVSLETAKHALVAEGPLRGSALLCVGAAALCWLLQIVTRNYSWTDRLWSIMPPVYALVFALSGGDARVWLMTTLVVAWGARLTFNFARKRGYDPREEDYRWSYVRRWLAEHDPLHPLGRELFSLFFIAAYQHVLIALISVPVLWVAWQARGEPLSAWDIAGAAAFTAFLVGETLADQQQWRFQNEKHGLSAGERAARGGDFANGFLSNGLFRFSRHFNFFCEQGMWWSLYVMGAGVVGQAVHFSGLGALLLTLLFQGSTNLTEKLSLQKYPAYADYQRRTSRLLPWWPKHELK